MEIILILVGLIILMWGIWKLGAPWRKYHEEHIVPLENKIVSAESSRADKVNALRQSMANADLFTRDFRAEVRRHQSAKSAAYDILKPLQARKAELHTEMNDVRSSLNEWHRSSKSFFGNKAQKIKDDSILGWLGLEQTVAQKESLERRRASIFSEIGDLKNEMSDIFEQTINPAKKGIQAAFDDQKPLKRFREHGLNEQYFRNEVKHLESEISEIDSQILSIKASISEATETFKRQRRSRKKFWH